MKTDEGVGGRMEERGVWEMGERGEGQPGKGAVQEQYMQYSITDVWV